MLPYKRVTHGSLPGSADAWMKGGNLGFNGAPTGAPGVSLDTTKQAGAPMLTKKAARAMSSKSLLPSGFKMIQAFAAGTAGLQKCAEAEAGVIVAKQELEWSEADLLNDAKYIDAHLAYLAKMNKRANLKKTWALVSDHQGGKKYTLEGTNAEMYRAEIMDAAKLAASWLKTAYWRYADQVTGNPQIMAYAGIPNVQPTESATVLAWNSNRQFFDYDEVWGSSQFDKFPGVADVLRKARTLMKQNAASISAMPTPSYAKDIYKDVWAGTNLWEAHVSGTPRTTLALFGRGGDHGWAPGAGCNAAAYESSADKWIGVWDFRGCVQAFNAHRIAVIMGLVTKMRVFAEKMRREETTWSADDAWAKEIPGAWKVGTISRQDLYGRLKSRGLFDDDVPGGYAGYDGSVKVVLGQGKHIKQQSAYLQFAQAVDQAKKDLRTAELTLNGARCYNMSVPNQAAAKAQGEIDAAVTIATRAADRAQNKMATVKALWEKLATKADYLYGYCKAVHDLDPTHGTTTPQLIVDRVNECAKNPKPGSPAYQMGKLQQELETLEEKHKACSSVLGKSHKDCMAVMSQILIVKAKLAGMSAFSIELMKNRAELREETVEDRTGEDGVYYTAAQALEACIKAKNAADVFYGTGDDKVLVKLTPEQQEECAKAIAKAEKAKEDADKIGTYVSAWGQQLLGLSNKFNLALPDYVKKKIVKNEKQACEAGAECPCPTGQVRVGDLCVPAGYTGTDTTAAGFPWWLAAVVAAPFLIGG